MAAPRSLRMALLLLGALGVLQAPAQAQAQGSVQPNFQPDQFLGRWFTAGLASNASWFREKKAALSMCSAVVAPAAPGEGDGALNLTTTFLRRDQCETRSLLLRPAGPPGSYSYTSLHWGSGQHVWVEETDYGEYALLYTVGAGDRGFHMATLYSRTQTPRAALREKFTTFAAAKGFAEEDVVFPPRTDKCLEEHQ